MKTTIVKTLEELNRAQEILIRSPKVAYDTETTGLAWYKNKIFMHSFSNGEDNFAIRNRYFNESTLNSFLSSILCDKNKIILGQNIKFDRHHLKKTHGIEILGKIRDTMSMSHMMDENNSVSLKARVKSVLGFTIDDKEAVDGWLKENLGTDRTKWDFSLVPEEIMDPYSAMDPYFCYKLDEHYWPSIQTHFKDLFETDMKVFDILFRMEQNGMPIDLDYMKSYQAILEEKLDTNKKITFKEFGAEFDINSPMEVAEVLYRKMKLPVPKVTGKGGDSTDDEALRSIDHPVARGIQQHRGLGKMLSTYVIPLQEQAVNGKIHPDFGLTRTRSGRFSCSDPNVQNITKDIDLRRAFTVEPGEEMWFWDQSQIEMIGFAMYSKDPKMVEALKNGQDLHTVTAQEVQERKEITKEERAMGKGTNFAIIFGVGKARLASYLTGYVGRQVTDLEAAVFKNKYMIKFPKVTQFQQLVMNTVKQHREPWGNFVKNTFGRVCRLTPDKAYVGVNRLVQSWAADLMKTAMVKIDEKYKPKWRQNIHDAIRIDLPTGNNTDIVRDISKLLTDFPTVGIPIKCTTERSITNWAEIEEVK